MNMRLPLLGLTGFVLAACSPATAAHATPAPIAASASAAPAPPAPASDGPPSSAAPSPPTPPAPVVGEMVKIPAGELSMGSSTGDDDEKPVHRVKVASYWLDRTEVTVEAFGFCVAAGACASPHTDDNCTWGAKGKEQHPINCIDWKDTAAYCAWAGKRLPTEAEWEYAARDGSEGRAYPWGDAAPDERRLNACGSECAAGSADAGERVTPMYPGSDGWATTAPVASFPAGDDRWGVHDLEGNVREWLSSTHCAYPAASCDSPLHVTRGAAYNDHLVFGVRGARRDWHSPNGVSTIGFRCARDA